MYNRYSNIKKETLTATSNRSYVNVIYPDIPYSEDDQYVITTIGDRLDLMAQDLYGDVSYWWILASANGLPGDSLTPPIGQQLRIPQNLQSIVNSFESINRVR